MKLKTLFFGQRETFLAGIENPLQPLSTMSGSVDPLVYQLPLRPAQLPSPEKNPSGNPTYNSETAIWSYNAASFEVTAR